MVRHSKGITRQGGPAHKPRCTYAARRLDSPLNRPIEGTNRRKSLSTARGTLGKIIPATQTEGQRILTAIDLFSGCGGLTRGLRDAGFAVLGAIEVEPVAVATYRHNNPDVVVWAKRIEDVTVAAVKKRLGVRRGELDLVAGCPPCEGFSSMRTLNGRRRVRDKRNNLIFEFLRFVRELLPKAIMLENVPRLAVDRRMRAVRAELKKLGYQFEVHVLDVANYGVPQRRRRMILLGSRFGTVSPSEIDPVRRTVRDAIGNLAAAGSSGDELHDLPERRTERIRQLIERIPPDGGSRADLGEGAQLACHTNFDGFHDVYGRMKWDKVAPTITSGCVNPSKGRFLHPSEHRTITLREAALLQSFPSDYFFSLERGKFHAAAMIGDALPPEFVKRHAIEIRRHLESETP